MRRYLVSMGIRTACFILAVVAIAVLHWAIVGWILVVAAVILPYIAVVMANATRSMRSTYRGEVPPSTANPGVLVIPERGGQACDGEYLWGRGTALSHPATISGMRRTRG